MKLRYSERAIKMKDILTAIKDRRSYYSIEKKSPISDDELIEALKTIVKNSPSGFNMQSGKIVILLDEHHDKLWDIVMNTLRDRVPTDKFGESEKKINGFAAGYGTVMYFDDKAIVEKTAEENPKYADNFRLWAEHGMGILQVNIWNVLEAMGFGVNIQHYNPIIDEEVKSTWNIPESWALRAQMPFGLPTAEPKEKEFLPIEERVKIYK